MKLVRYILNAKSRVSRKAEMELEGGGKAPVYISPLFSQDLGGDHLKIDDLYITEPFGLLSPSDDEEISSADEAEVLEIDLPEDRSEVDASAFEETFGIKPETDLDLAIAIAIDRLIEKSESLGVGKEEGSAAEEENPEEHAEEYPIDEGLVRSCRVYEAVEI